MVMGNNILTYEELKTLINQDEGILNSRPLNNSDSTDVDYLTPGHFLIGAPLKSFPETNLTDIPQNRLKFWRLCVQMQQHFWQKWYQDYLTQFQNRPKWRKSLPNLQEEMVALVKEYNVASFRLSTSRNIKTIPGKDGKVRVVEVKTKNGTYLRSVPKIAVLPINNKDI
ncbi:uncharacterized protein [Diabrotica undecimpunctata]|uniref:uncharacterized protein n=1 Tax=Diabrotica undecimpunctata TaxID=50387 RepID=UPI003B634658